MEIVCEDVRTDTYGSAYLEARPLPQVQSTIVDDASRGAECRQLAEAECVHVGQGPIAEPLGLF